MTKDEKERAIGAKEAEISCLRTDLDAPTSEIGDWKIIKIYEARLAEQPDPYDYAELSKKRQAARDRINALQTELEQLAKVKTKD